MSTSKGNNSRTRPQRYQNKTAFKNDLHDKSPKTKLINSLDVTGVCKRCKDIIDWKIKYKKYKPLTAPKKCVSCDQKAVKHAYHIMCKTCAKNDNVCPKCCKHVEVIIEDQAVENHHNDFQNLLDTLTERKKRTLFRCLNKVQSQKNNNIPDADDLLKSTIEKLKISKSKGDNDEDYDDSDDDDLQDSFASDENLHLN